MIRTRILLAVLALAATGGAVPGIAGADLTFNGTIEGTVNLWGTGDPVAGAEVRGLGDFGPVAAVTDANGYYQLNGLEPGDYEVAFLRSSPSDPYWYYPGTYTWGQATTLTITDDEVYSGIDGMVQDEGTIIGRVTAWGTGNPVAGVCANVYDTYDTLVGTAVSDIGGWLHYPGVTVDTSDRWLATKAWIYDCNNLGYSEQWYLGIVEYLSLRGRFDAQLAPPGDIAGTVTDEFGGPVSGVCVSLWSGATEIDSHTTDSEGDYGFSGVIAGDYELDFEDCNTVVTHGSVFDVPISVTGGEVTYYDQTLPWASTITGTVTDATTGLPLQEICVLGTEHWFQGGYFWTDLTDAFGNYTLIVPPGSSHQYVRAYWCGGSPALYGEQWWNGVASYEEATDLLMAPLEHRTGVDIAVPKMASLEGTLTGADGLPAQTNIWLYPQFEGAHWVPVGTSNPDGTYLIDGIGPGEYHIRFGSDHPTSTYAVEWHDDVALQADATPVVFDWGDVLTIGAELGQVGVLEWDFTIDWEASPTMCVYATDTDGQIVKQLSAGSQSHSVMGGLVPGEYLLFAEDCDTGEPDVAPVWYPNAATRVEAALLTVENDVTDLGEWAITGNIPGPSSLSGSITRDGAPADVCVTVFDEELAILAETTASAGSYSVDGLVLHGPQAALFVKAEDCADPGLAAWHGGAALEHAAAIPFGLGIDWSDIDIELPGHPPEPPPPPEFSDADGSVFSADIEWLAGEGITKGCNPPTNDMFCPDAPVTRGQMAAFLHRALGDVLVAGDTTEFVDDDGSVFEADIQWLGSVGVTRGCNPPTNDMFCPNAYVTRGQMAAFLARALNLPQAGDDIEFLDDEGSVFQSDIDRLAAAGITRGCNPPTNDMFCPNAYVTRGQMAAFLHRALG